MYNSQFAVSGLTVIWFIVYLILTIGVFLLLRNFWCWYIKMNKVVSLLEEQNKLLSRLVGGYADAGSVAERNYMPSNPPGPPPPNPPA